jgi:hypothetical protein
MDKETVYWVKSVLTNDECASDEEMRACFIEHGLSEAHEWIAKRSFFRNNIVIEDDDHNDIGVYDPKTGRVQPLPSQ